MAKRLNLNIVCISPLKLTLQENNVYIGTIDSAFGKSGKFKVSFTNPIPKDCTSAPLKFKYKICIFDEKRTWYQ